MRLSLGLTAFGESPVQDALFMNAINWFPSETRQGATPSSMLLPSPGLKLLIDCEGQEVRALMPFEDYFYAVVDEKLYQIEINVGDRTGTKFYIGSLSTNSGIVKWAKNPTQIMMADNEGNGYILTPSTDILAPITDPQFPGAGDIVFMDSYFIFNEPGTARIWATALNDGSSIDGLDVATAEGQSDRVVGLAVDKRELYVFGERTVEIWFDAGFVEGFPFARRDGSYMDIGCGAAGSIRKFNNTLLWIDHRSFVVANENYNPMIISDGNLTNKLQTMSTISDIVSFEFECYGHSFYALSCPSTEKTYVFDNMTKLWHEIANYDPLHGFTRHKVQVTEYYGNFILGGARDSGKIYVLGSQYTDNAGEEIRRVCRTESYEDEYKMIPCHSVELLTQSGYAATSGLGENPKIELRYSEDGGHTWSNYLEKEVGRLGEYNNRVRWNNLGTAREWLFEFSTTSNQPMALIDLILQTTGSTST